MYHLYPDLANEHIDWLLDEAERDRLAGQARAARRRRRERNPQRARGG
jgi:hypothetical protein